MSSHSSRDTEDRFTHADGRQCRYLPYALDGVAGLLKGWFHGMPPDMAKCHREHGLEDQEDEQP
jgi:hypothetical protein